MAAVWSKICGLTRRQDAEWALSCGADALGMVLFPGSKRAVDVARVSSVFADLETQTFALFVDPTKAEVDAALQTGCFTGLQFHGAESEEFCNSFDLPYMKGIKAGGGTDLAEAIEGYPSAERILLDTYDKHEPGGTGKTFDWKLTAATGIDNTQRLVLAGGLNPGNVASAIGSVNPFGVDVASGVESSPGIKDADKVKSFIEEARSVRG